MFKRSVSKTAKLLFLLLALILLSNATAAHIKNWGSVDRQCATDEEWVENYYAFRNIHCAADSQQNRQARQDQTPPQSDDQPQQQQSQPGTVSIVLGPTMTPGTQEHENDESITIIIQPITKEQMCRLWPGLVMCEQ